MNLNEFLASVEKRAFRIVRFSTHSDDDALDVVQEAMTRLISRYRDRGPDEWQPLFFRILENCLMDYHRQQQRFSKLFFWRKSARPDDQDGPLESEGSPEAELGPEAGSDALEPGWLLGQERQRGAVMETIAALPVQQQQCFLLRCWEGMSVRETAAAMSISEGSVKTHLSRARQKLNEVVEAHGQ